MWTRAADWCFPSASDSDLVDTLGLIPRPAQSCQSCQSCQSGASHHRQRPLTRRLEVLGGGLVVRTPSVSRSSLPSIAHLTGVSQRIYELTNQRINESTNHPSKPPGTSHILSAKSIGGSYPVRNQSGRIKPLLSISTLPCVGSVATTVYTLA